MRSATPLKVLTGNSGIGASATRPDGGPKVKGEFAYSSDLWADDMLWGKTLRSPYPYARIRSIDITDALTYPGVFAVMTHADLPGATTYGLITPDQPVLAEAVVRFKGEPVALVAADHPETARRAVAKIRVDYEVLAPLTDPEVAIAGEGPRLHSNGNIVNELHIRRGDVARVKAQADVSVRGTYELGMQDQAFLGPESGLALPTEDGGVELFVATQWLHVDRGQIAPCLDLPPEKVKLVLAGVGGAFGGREDVSIQIHACLLALRTGRPVKMMYTRDESFFGHVHRHPGRLEYEHGATRDGDVVYVTCRIVLDGGAYQSTSREVVVVAASTAIGPYDVTDAEVDAWVTYTNNPPCGAMRGFGAVQSCFAYEAQMDKVAAALDMCPLELRKRNALVTGGSTVTGQIIPGPVSVRELIDLVAALPEPSGETVSLSPHLTPGGVSNSTHGEAVRRGIGYAVGFKNIGFSSGHDDYSTARVRLTAGLDGALVEVHTAAPEVGQGGIVVQAQIARAELGVERVVVRPADTDVGDAGSTSASRQTWITGGAVRAACVAVRERLLRRAAEMTSIPSEELLLAGDELRTFDGRVVATVSEVVNSEPIEETREYRPRRTAPLDARGQGDVHMAFAFAVHRATVHVDTELGLVRVVEVATAQDVGRAMNPLAIEGQIEGGIAQGLGLALMEEVRVENGEITNPSFTDYLIPTMLDMPRVVSVLVENPQPGAPYGLNGVGEPPTISSTPAIVAAIRNATNKKLVRVPVRPEDIIGLVEP